MDYCAATQPSAVVDGPLLIGRVLDGKGGAVPITWAAAQDWRPQRPGEVLWLHLLRSAPGVGEFLEHDLEIPAMTIDVLMSDQTRPRAWREGQALIATLRDLNFNPGADPEDMISMQLWSDGSHVVTLRRLPQQSPNELRDQLDHGHGPRDAGAMLTRIVERMIDHLSGAVIEINEAIDRLDGKQDGLTLTDQAAQISQIRRESLALQRHMSPQHEALEQIARDAPEWFEQHDRREMAQSIARLRRHLDDIDISKESALVLLDDLRTRAQATSQEATYKLGVMAGVFLPLTFLTGLVGSNVAGIPYADRPWAFAGLTMTCLALALVILAIFKRLRWL